MSKKVAQIIVETLEQAGVRNCYGVVGDTLNLIAHNISTSSIDWIHMRHEEAGAFAAQGEALLTGGLTAIAGSCGPGSLHFINGVVEANRNRAPVIVIATQVVRDELGFDFPQEIDFKAIYGSCSVYCDMILTPNQARRKTVMACQAALAKRGVAVLVVPVDISHSDVHDDVPYAVHTSDPLVRPIDADLDRAAAFLNNGQKVAIYGGSGCRDAHDAIIRLAGILKAPVAHTSRGKDALAYDNPYNVGMTGIIGTEAGYQALHDCDTLLLLGADFAWRQFYPKHARIVQIDLDPTHLGRRHPIALGLTGDIKATVEALIPRVQEKTDTHFLDRLVKRYHEVITSHMVKAAPKRRDTISGIHLTEVIDRMAADDALVTGDDGTPTVWMHRYFTATAQRRFFGSLLHGTMASAMPTALGLQKAAPDRQVIALSGDGGIAMLFGDLLTAVQEKLPIKIAVYDNGKLGFIDIEQKSEGLLPLYTHLQNPDFGKVAEAMGLWGRSVSRADELEEAVGSWLAHPGPALLNVKVEGMTLVMPPVIEFGPAYGMALYSARAILGGQSQDVIEMIQENFL
ncbi:thiamine pyrophosphate protein central region [Nitrospirillum viridazoti Y2]|uniref:Pyruvate dehydrogenase (Quinone) n=1 Tax=Nitrospirillum amazonense TaxID=28077 RepID=A0A560HTT7_9PROT|nr:ubiquinone-dependent pyruvate dehydrogenase [Nitrospirillum amazonense]EGY02681.1 thiamine pyrophosphate protein central region [Nitrospirillum amazonense Y2]TWB48939.1 pyruvate dehydrogenase (quinone) [Nitrospirillum amazonense]